MKKDCLFRFLRYNENGAFMKFFFFLAAVFLIGGCGTEPNIHNTIGGKMMRRQTAYTTYAGNSPTNIFYSAEIAGGTVFAGSQQGLLRLSEDSLQPVGLDGLQTGGNVRVFGLHAVSDAVSGNVLFVASDKGLFRLPLPDGKTAEKLDPPGNGAAVQFLCVTSDENGVLYAGTYKNGFYVSEDGGGSWIHVPADDFKLYTGAADLTYDGYKAAEKADAAFAAEAGLIKIEPHYTGSLKSSTVCDICVYDGVIYAATFGGGLAYTPRPDSFAGWQPVWESYLRPWYFFSSEAAGDFRDAVDGNRAAEADWTLRSRFVRRVSVQPFGIFAATADGISLTSHGGKIGDRDVSDAIPFLDDFGRFRYAATVGGATVFSSAVRLDENGTAAAFESARLIRRSAVRLWKEYGSGGTDEVDGFVNEKSVDYIEEYDNGMALAGMESDNVSFLRFGQINSGKTKLFYAGTECGLSIAELRKYTDVTGLTFTSSDLVDSWVTYHNVLTAFEETRVTDAAVQVGADGDDQTVYVASNGQGLIVFRWEE